jgi:disulfide oxidoreductase YuzD
MNGEPQPLNLEKWGKQALCRKFGDINFEIIFSDLHANSDEAEISQD